jgi:hypothetical protein
LKAATRNGIDPPGHALENLSYDFTLFQYHQTTKPANPGPISTHLPTLLTKKLAGLSDYITSKQKTPSLKWSGNKLESE